MIANPVNVPISITTGTAEAQCGRLYWQGDFVGVDTLVMPVADDKSLHLSLSGKYFTDYKVRTTKYGILFNSPKLASSMKDATSFVVTYAVNGGKQKVVMSYPIPVEMVKKCN